MGGASSVQRRHVSGLDGVHAAVLPEASRGETDGQTITGMRVSEVQGQGQGQGHFIQYRFAPPALHSVVLD